ncbi:MAG: glycine cleavage system protein H [Actinomycetota bacterium]|nr:glycine cleavage system protein H [Actinomycetota bacterium]
MAKYKEFELPDELYYDRKEHIWAKLEDGKVRSGVDQFGQKAAGTVAYVKIKPAGAKVIKGRAFGSLEAGKYIGPMKAPVNGSIIEVNEAVVKNPSLINSDPHGEGWCILIEPSALDEDVKDLAHGDEVQPWLEAEYKDYEEKGLFAEE